MFWEPQEKDKVRSRLGDDLYGLEDGELESLVFLTQLGEKYGRNGIQGKDSANIHYAGFISSVAEHGSDRRGEGYHQRKEGRTDAEDCDECT